MTRTQRIYAPISIKELIVLLSFIMFWAGNYLAREGS
jgi:hypothetical protein